MLIGISIKFEKYLNMYYDKFLKSYNEYFSKDNQKVINDFFVVFFRFEYALKKAGFINQGKQNKVLANWDQFISNIRKEFESIDSYPDIVSDSISYIMNHPPNIQVLDNGRLIWKPRSEINNETPLIHNLSLRIRDIRNNLFHGGKYRLYDNRNPTRDVRLIKSALVILDYWLEMNKDVNKFFFKI